MLFDIWGGTKIEEVGVRVFYLFHVDRIMDEKISYVFTDI